MTIVSSLCIDCSRSAILQHVVEGVCIQKVARPHHDIGRQMLAIVTYADAAHPRSAGALNTRDRILNNNALVWGHPNAFCRDEIDFRIRLASVHVFTCDDSVKDMSGRQHLEDCLDIRARRSGSNGLTPALPA